MSAAVVFVSGQVQCRLCIRGEVRDAAQGRVGNEYRGVQTSGQEGRGRVMHAVVADRGVMRKSGLETSVAGQVVEQALLSTAQDDMGLTDTSLESSWLHRAWVGVGIGTLLGMLAKSWLAATEAGPEGEVMAVLGVGAGYLLADLGSGIYHWGVDNYGDASTPVFGAQIDAFQGHHRRPWTITRRQFANNIHAVAAPVTFFLAPFLLLPNSAGGDAFLAAFLGCITFSQQFHAWAHSKKSQLHPLVVMLQERGLLVHRKMHGAHHLSPYDINYCIVSGIWNPLLDETAFFARLERAVFSWSGVRPRCWGQTSPEWMQQSYYEDGTDIDSSSNAE